MTYRKTGTLAGPYKPENRDSSGTLAGSYKPKNRDPSGTLAGPNKKPENLDPNETLRKPKKPDTVLQWGPKTGKAGPNVTLEKLSNCKSTFICALAQKAAEFRKQNFKHINFISFNLIATVSILKRHL